MTRTMGRPARRRPGFGRNTQQSALPAGTPRAAPAVPPPAPHAHAARTADIKANRDADRRAIAAANIRRVLRKIDNKLGQGRLSIADLDRTYCQGGEH